mmetsp:Transcript_8914/g.14167  ORF Transcript_8914/g.14167 Transcript_8914/m.14167 type:complete len:90 (-) Transcript_8914:578-847(-)
MTKTISPMMHEIKNNAVNLRKLPLLLLLRFPHTALLSAADAGASRLAKRSLVATIRSMCQVAPTTHTRPNIREVNSSIRHATPSLPGAN